MIEKRTSTLDLASEAKKIRGIYDEARTEKSFTAMLSGDSGTGKTHSLATAPKPILIHSFDPGGLETVSDQIKDGYILPDVRYESEEAHDPRAFGVWEKEMARLQKANVFQHFGTFCIDSLTTWSEAMMNEILRRGSRAGGIPQLQDYLVQMNTVRDWMKVMSNLPCAFIVTTHIDVDKDEVTGRMITSPLVTGKRLRAALPLYFSEWYVATVTKTSKGPSFKFLTKPDGIYKARTRLGAGGKLDASEEPDFSKIIKKVGFPCVDKPYDFMKGGDSDGISGQEEGRGDSVSGSDKRAGTGQGGSKGDSKPASDNR